MIMNRLLAAAVFAAFATSSHAAPFSWVNGKVTSFTAQLPMFTVAVVNNKVVRFCNPSTGADYAVTAADLEFDLLKTAFLQGKAVQVGVNDFGKDPQSGTEKLCIDRVIITQ
jgi:hypothetical protein